MAIITVDDLNTYLGEDDITEKKTMLCEAVSGYVEQATGRTWDAAQRREWQFLVNARKIYLAPDVSTIALIAVGTTEALRVCWPPGRVDVNSRPITQAQINVLRGASAAAKMLVTPYEGGAIGEYETVDLTDLESIADCAEALGNLGWSAEVINEGLPVRLRPMAIENAVGREAVLELPGEPTEANLTDAAAGIIELPMTCRGWVFTDYTTGATPPADLKQLACEIAAYAISKSLINTAVQSEKIGDYSYTIGSQSGTASSQALGLPIEFAQRLALYRRVAL